MNRVSTSGNYSALLNNLMAAQQRQVEAGNQVSSERKASDLKGYARDAETLTAVRSMRNRVDGFLDQTQILVSRLSMQDNAMGQVSDAAQSARDAIANALATGSGSTLMQELQLAFTNTVQGLNTKFQGEYLFAGGQVNTAATSAGSLSDLTAAPTTASLFQNDQFKTSNRLDESTTLQTGFLASDVGGPLFDAFKTVQAYSETPAGNFGGSLTDAQKSFLEGVLAGFDTVHNNLINTNARNGLLQSQVDNARQDLSTRKDALEESFGDLTNVDMAAALTRLQQAQTSVQAAAQVFQGLKDASLLNYLR
ncbi:flagellar hook-associated protein 3 FlgL [Caulobacter ginsengisoli]|uniref:Flagellin n=1 Tax=Caulobacter ginsengisoli TaxID=400775 RepID=A0ABU0IQV9_9CAUL|nr:flagellin [Caulobacter ginsengisoli]MDQ0463337.1 flagellar hook-associated protein 3 FlgL [Caulobacter ginsengisoli]